MAEIVEWGFFMKCRRLFCIFLMSFLLTLSACGDTSGVNPSMPTETSSPELLASPEPDASPLPQPEVLSSPEPVASPSPEPETSPSPEPETSPSPEPETSPSPEPEVSPSPEPETSPSPEPETSPSPEPETSPSPEPETSPSPEPETSPSPEPETSPSPEPETSPSPEPETSPSPEPEASPSPEPETSPSPEPETSPSPEPETSPSPEPETSPSPEPEVSSPSVLPILMYHSVVEDGRECNVYEITAGTFRAHLQWLHDRGYTTILPSELASGAPLPEKAVLIVFDDGYANNYLRAFPVLQEFGAKASVSLITSQNGDSLASGFLTWEMCREMAASGLVEFGSHTHALHIDTGIQRLEDETMETYETRVFSDIDRSIALIRENLGTAPSFFAHPLGLTETWAQDFLSSRFPVTFISAGSAAGLSASLYDLPRINVHEVTILSNYLS